MTAETVVLGGGSWGTALAVHLARSGQAVSLWVHDPRLAEAMLRDRVNEKYLPGHAIPESVAITPDLCEAIAGRCDVIVAVPSHHCREVLSSGASSISSARSLVVASKGIENSTLMRISEIAGEVLSGAVSKRIAVLSGPSFAQEVALGHPTAVVVSSRDTDLAARLQRSLSSGNLRVYASADTIGVELGGALKNVIAIGAGAVAGLGYGTNTLAALITRGLAEISALAEALGGRRETLAGLAGLGDLVLTCTGALSRNRALGLGLGRGLSLAECQASTPMVAEGVRTARSAHMLARRHRVDMPITDKVHALLYDNQSPADAISELLARDLKREDA